MIPISGIADMGAKKSSQINSGVSDMWGVESEDALWHARNFILHTQLLELYKQHISARFGYCQQNY